MRLIIFLKHTKTDDLTESYQYQEDSYDFHTLKNCLFFELILKYHPCHLLSEVETLYSLKFNKLFPISHSKATSRFSAIKSIEPRYSYGTFFDEIKHNRQQQQATIGKSHSSY